MTDINHAERAKRLSDLIDGESKVNDDSLEDIGLDLESDPPVVPFRYAAPTYDGYGTWMELADTLAQMRGQLEAAICGENPYAPGDVTDLDTGTAYRAVVNVTLPPLDKYMAALKILARLQRGEAVLDAFVAEQCDPDEVVSEDSSALAIEDVENNVIDFCDGVLLRRVGAHVKRGRDHMPVVVDPGEWTLETY